MIIDTNRRTSAKLDCLRNAGVAGMIRYYARTTGQSEKRLTRAEAQSIIAGGFSLCIVHQAVGSSADSFSHARGLLDGAYARNYGASVIGQPGGSAIYFAVDFDTNVTELENRVVPYFQALQQILAASSDLPDYRIGVYGNGLVCRVLLDRKLAELAWLSQSTGHREHAAFKASNRWALAQGPSGQLCGIGFDPNETYGGFGEFTKLSPLSPPLGETTSLSSETSEQPSDNAHSLNSQFDAAAFDKFVSDQGFRHFKPYELLVMGSQHASPGSPCRGLNTFPPRGLWSNIAPTVRVLDILRDRLGAAIRITNAYRNEDYNNCIGGAENSAHLSFQAIDFVAEGGGRPSDWARTLRSMRDDERLFEGGVGQYTGFVHVDTNGVTRDWQG